MTCEACVTRCGKLLLDEGKRRMQTLLVDMFELHLRLDCIVDTALEVSDTAIAARVGKGRA
jgi:hypothetical protein